MASAPQAAGMPPLYRQLEPLSSNVHGGKRMRPQTTATFAANIHAFPLTVEEFVLAHRQLPIIFSSSTPSVPLVLMGLNDGVNVFIGEDGTFPTNFYVPAYIRRYPFMLVRMQPDSEDLTLCFDPTSSAVSEDEGEPLFDGDQPSQFTRNALEFCEKFEQAASLTANFMNDLEETKLLIDGEVTIKREEDGRSFTYRGFRMVNEEALREMRGDQLRKLMQNGMLPLIYTHLFSLSILSEVFGLQTRQGKVPEQDAAPIPTFQPAM